MRIRTYIGVSLDGFMATAEGLPVHATLPTFEPGKSHGLGEFLADISTVVVGRNTFDAGHHYYLSDGNWAWEGHTVYVLTSRPLPENAHADVIASEGGPEGLLAQLKSANIQGDVHVVGGESTIRAFHALGAIEELSVLVVPVLLGTGVPLYPLGDAPVPLHLERTRSFDDGAVVLTYTRA